MTTGLRRAAGALLLACACRAHAPPPPPAPQDDPRAVLDRFTVAVEAGRWAEAYPLLSGRWRARLTPEVLASDLDAAGPVGRDAVRRVRALLAAGASLAVAGDGAALPVGGARAARLVREGAAWRVDALE